MNRKVLLVVVALAALAALGIVALLSADAASPGAAPAAAAHRADNPSAALPTFRDDTPAPERAPQTLQAAPGAVEPGAAPAEPQAARPSGPTRTIAGRVLRASDGTPIEGVDLSIRTHAPQPPPLPKGVQVAADEWVIDVTGKSAADGTFELTIPAAAPQLTVSTPHRNQSVELPPGEQDLRNLEIVFDSGFRVAGRVLDEAGAPLVGASVDVAKQGEGTTDEAGRFLLKDIAPDEQQTVVEARAWAPWRVRAKADVIAPRDVTEMPFVELRLAGSGRLEGRVTHADGSPAIMAVVDVAFHMETGGGNEPTEELSTSTNESGAYDVDHVPAARYLVRAGGKSVSLLSMAYQVAANGQGGVEVHPAGQPGDAVPEVWVQDVVVTTGQVTHLDIVLPAGALLAGRVLDAGGSPVPRAHVLLERRARWPAPDINGSSIMTTDGMSIETRGGDGKGETLLRLQEARVDADEHGHFEFPGLGAGERLLVATDPDGRLAPAQRTIVLSGDERLTSYDLVLSAGLVLRSRVTDPAGHPLAGAGIYIKEAGSSTITAADLKSHSGDDGYFEASGLSPGKKTISISLDGYANIHEEVDPEAPPAAYVMQPAPRIHGEVVDALTGQPVEAFEIKIAKESSIMIDSVSSRPGGTFVEDVENDELCAVTISAPGYEPLELKQVQPSATLTSPLRFRLQPKS
ncbi:MAG TPA: carboxypeptidase regulatory-like domain-containing protein [Planctomycetota bacterium]|nr:carboxypeptidase regulatory-like domain-containing protein [Planctomycetota bacterium]